MGYSQSKKKSDGEKDDVGCCGKYFLGKSDGARSSLLKRSPSHKETSADEKEPVELPFVVNKKEKERTPSFKKSRLVTLQSFSVIKIIGRGSFGKVYLVQRKDTKEYFAMKSLKKTDILNKNQLENIVAERNILKQIRHPFIVKLKYAFQTEEKIHFILEFLQGGELFFHLRAKGKFPEEKVIFYSAEVLLALEYLHTKLQVIYRDLKPENIMLDSEGHIKLTDFGLAQHCKKSNYLYSFCGTPDYLAPEILLEIGYNYSVDLWTLGCLIYEMIEGDPPFKAPNKNILYKNIIQNEVKFTPNFSPAARELVKSLLTKNPAQRPPIRTIKQYAFYESINWEDLYARKIASPFFPTITDPLDTSNFAEIGMSLRMDDTPVEHPIDKKLQEYFKDFTYRHEGIVFEENEEDSDDNKNNITAKK